MKVIVGLGNPGTKYRNTRHNAGFRALDCLAERLNASFTQEKYESLITRAEFESERLLLVKPLTFMNKSGVAVAQAARNKISGLTDLLVVVDDIHLPLGRLRFRVQGSAGGHKGLSSVIEHVGSPDFARLRLGVGANDAGHDLIDHVLGTFRPEEQPEVAKMIENAVDGILCFLGYGIETAMNDFN